MDATEIATGRTRQPTHDETCSEAVIDAVAAAEGVQPWELDAPLNDVIDPDALDRLFRHGGIDGSVEFTYAGYRVTVDGGGEVTVSEADE